MVESAGALFHHAYTYGGETRKLITVKLADQKCLGKSKENPGLERRRAHTKRKFSGVSSSSQLKIRAC